MKIAAAMCCSDMLPSVCLGQKQKYVCFLFHPVKSLGRVGRLSFFFFNFFYNLILTTKIQHIKVAHSLEHRSGISRHVV